MLSLATLILGAAGAYAAASYPPIPADLTTPVQQRIAIQSPSQISVAWNTYTKLAQACVQYGTSSKSLTSKACSNNAVTYPTSRTYFNTVQLTGLKPATNYYYKIVSTNSSVQHFFSPRVAGDTTPFTLNAVIDMGVYGADGYTIDMDMSKRSTIPTLDPSLNHTTIGRLFNTLNQYEFIIHPGDLAYADDWYEKAHNILDGTNAFEAILEQFYNQLAPISGVKPYMASPGNHEADCTEIPNTAFACAEGQRNFTDFNNRFGASMPKAFVSTSKNSAAKINANKAAQLAKAPFWFSFEYGMVHVTMIDTETDFADAPDGPGGSAGLNGGPFGFTNQQLEFIDADLASVDRTVTPWVIVAGHRPWYTTGTGCAPCQSAFETLLYKYGVDLAVFGHVHNSQSIVPIYNGTADPNGFQNPTAPYYVVAGGAGNIEGLSSASNPPSYVSFAYDTDFSYATIQLADKNHMNIKFIRSYTGEVLDSTTLYKKHSQQFVRNL